MLSSTKWILGLAVNFVVVANYHLYLLEVKEKEDLFIL